MHNHARVRAYGAFVADCDKMPFVEDVLMRTCAKVGNTGVDLDLGFDLTGAHELVYRAFSDGAGEEFAAMELPSPAETTESTW